MTVANLFARIGLKADTDKAEAFSKSVKNITSDLKTAALGAVAFGAAMVASMKGALETAKVYRDFQNESGASTDELQRWQAVAAGANVSTDALAESVKTLAQNREKIKLGGGNMSGFAFLGINPMDDPFDILAQLREKTAGLPQAMKRNLLEQMGVSSQFLQILNLTNSEFDRMRNNAFIIPPSAFEAMNRTQGALNNLGKMVQWFQALLAERLAPVIEKTVKDIMNWVQANKTGLIDGIVKGTQFILKFIEAIVNVATWINRIVTNTIGWKNALIAFLAVWAVFNAGLLASPITWIVGGILLLIAVLDDLHAALHIDGDNRKSFFGDMMDKNKGLAAFFTGLFQGVKDFMIVLKDLGKGDYGDLSKMTKQWGAFGDAIKIVVGFITQVKQLLFDLFTGNWGKILDNQTNNGVWAKLGLDDKSITNWILGLFGQKLPESNTSMDPSNFSPEALNAVAKAQEGKVSTGPITYQFTFNGAIPSDAKQQQELVDKFKKGLKEVEANRGKAQ